MSELRATKSGFAREAQAKIDAKYNRDEARECMEWISRTIGEPINTSGEPDAVCETLKNGVVLLKLYKAIDPKSDLDIEKVKKGPGRFKDMERIEMFTTRIKGPVLKIPQHSTFQTVDLVEQTNMLTVITCLQTVARKCMTADTPVRGYGPKEADANKREFSEEQLAQGKNIIGLQMGSNKGASQAGQNFGKARHIVD